MDASQYKDYVLVLLFIKYVSDKYAGQKDSIIDIPSGASFTDLVKLKGQSDIGDKINKIIGSLAKANDLNGIITVADFNDDDKLGKGKDMVDRLSNLISIFENPALDFSSNRAYHRSEQINAEVPLNPGPLLDMFKKLSFFQKLEQRKMAEESSYVQILKTAIITARNAPAHARMINTLKSWGVTVDEVFLLGGIEKKRILEVMKPHMYFDDQTLHLNATSIPQVHIPFGVTNVEILQNATMLAETGSTLEK